MKMFEDFYTIFQSVLNDLCFSFIVTNKPNTFKNLLNIFLKIFAIYNL